MKTLKHILFLVLVLSMTFVMCSCLDANTLNSYLGMLGLGTPHTCADANGDALCDICGAAVTGSCTSHIDNDNDGVCDNAGCNGTVPMEMLDVTFKSKSFTYDGKPKTLEVKDAPAGAEITYDVKNTQTDAGKYKITATITADGYVDCELTATLTIKPKTITIDWGEKVGPFASTGKIPTVKYELSGVVSGDTVEVDFDFGDCDFTENGVGYEVVATSKNPNYKIKATDGANRAEFSVESLKVTFETGIEGKTIKPDELDAGDTVSKPSILNNGYEFLGWYNGDELWDFDTPVYDPMTLTAKWKPINYTITYYLDGGTNSSRNPSTFTVENLTPLSVPTKAGSLFLGWFLDKDYKEVATQLGSSAANQTLYAKWSSVEYVNLVPGKTIDSSNSSIILDKTAVNGAFTYTFVADITEFGDEGAVYIGRGKDTLDGSYIKITKDNIFIYTNGLDGEVYIKKNHTRKLVGYLFLELNIVNGTADMNFYTSDGNSSIEEIDWSGRNGEIFFSSENVTLSNASFGWYTSAYDELAWIIGDETIGSPESNSFTNVLTQNKYGNYLAIGANGLTAADVFGYFKDACKVSTPKYAVWSFRADTSADYDKTVEDFVSFCKSNNIVPVLTTQPSTATVDNTARNAAVRASGERYIDFDDTASYGKVVVEDKYTNYGATALYARFMADFPEIICAEATMRTKKTESITGVSPDLMYPENYDVSSDVVYDSAGNVTLKYGKFEEHRKEGKDIVIDSALTMKGNAIKDGKYLVFSAKIDGTLSEDQTILLGQGYMSSTGKWIEINGKYCLATGWQSWGNARINPTTKTAHGLTIKNYITVVISYDTSSSKKIMIYTDGGSATVAKQVNSNAGDIFVTSAGVELKDVTLSYTCKDYAKDVWVFGDSYLSIGDPARWPTHLLNDGYYTSLMVGASGMSTQEGLAQLEDAIQYGTPKYIVWLEGMNNGEKNGNRNAGYHDSMKRVFEICEEKNITLYVATIPNCPKADHTIKNNAIYNGLDEFAGKDYKIIDWARAVENFEESTYWYEGMINENDLIHPAVLGAKALYMQLIVDAPEIMGGTNATIYEKQQEELLSGSTITLDTPDTVEFNKIFTLRADYNGTFDGTLTIGNGKGVEGGTWAVIDSNYVTVYQTVNGIDVEIKKFENLIVMEDLLNLKIHVKGEVASITFASVAEKGDSLGNRTFSIDVNWSSVGDAYITVRDEDFKNVKFAWHTFAK